MTKRTANYVADKKGNESLTNNYFT